jgi:hypothetical protein
MFDACVVLTAHAEGGLLQKSWLSLLRARAASVAHGLSTQAIVVLDRATPETDRVASNLPCMADGDQVIHLDEGDVGEARNRAAAMSSAEWIGVLDGDDYVSESWITASVTTGRSGLGRPIVHPEWVISFGGPTVVHRQYGDDDISFRRGMLLVANPWNSCSFAHREIRAQFPYRRSDVASRGFGHEDWLWHCDTLAAGCAHRIAPGTLHCVRLKSEGSMNNDHKRQFAMPAPSRFFELP